MATDNNGIRPRHCDICCSDMCDFATLYRHVIKHITIDSQTRMTLITETFHLPGDKDEFWLIWGGMQVGNNATVVAKTETLFKTLVQ